LQDSLQLVLFFPQAWDTKQAVPAGDSKAKRHMKLISQSDSKSDQIDSELLARLGKADVKKDSE
jgi:hypothetical protein